MTLVRQSFTNKPRFSAIPSQLAVAITAPAGFSAGVFLCTRLLRLLARRPVRTRLARVALLNARVHAVAVVQRW